MADNLCTNELRPEPYVSVACKVGGVGWSTTYKVASHNVTDNTGQE